MTALGNPNNQLLKKWRTKPENKACIDCSAKNPDWCSVPFGVWICMDCAGIHRSLGTHISFVRSPVYDGWSDEQTLFMQLGGNSRARTAFKKHGIDGHHKAHQKYSSTAAIQYKRQLRAEVDKALDQLRGEGRTLAGGAAAVVPRSSPGDAPLSSSSSSSSKGNGLDEIERSVRQEIASMDALSLESHRNGDNDDDDDDDDDAHGREQYKVVKSAAGKKKKNSITVTRKLSPSSPIGGNGRKDILDGSRLRDHRSAAASKSLNGNDDIFRDWNKDDDWDKNDEENDSEEEDGEGDGWGNDWNNDNESDDDDNNAHRHRGADASLRSAGIGSGSSGRSNHVGNNGSANRYQGIASEYSASKKKNQQGLLNADLSTLVNMNASDMTWYMTEKAKEIYGRKGEYAEKAIDTAQNVTRTVGKWFSDLVNEN